MFFFENLDHDVSAPHLPQIWRRGLAFVASSGIPPIYCRLCYRGTRQITYLPFIGVKEGRSRGCSGVGDEVLAMVVGTLERDSYPWHRETSRFFHGIVMIT
jgi:hypothetical protein